MFKIYKVKQYKIPFKIYNFNLDFVDPHRANIISEKL